MIIDPYKFLNTGKFFEHALLEAVSSVGRDFVTNLPKVEEGEDKGKIKPFEMTMTLAGKEVDIISFFEHMESQFKSCVEKEAANIVAEKYQDKLNVIHEQMNTIERFLEGEVEKIVPLEER